MIIIGAGGHARELAGVFAENGDPAGLYFFDDVSVSPPAKIWDRFPILRTEAEVKKVLAIDPRFIIGVGKPALRKLLFDRFQNMGGRPFSIISNQASIGRYNVQLGAGLNVLSHAVITQDIFIGTGCLVHVNVSVHHDCRIGEFCELSPGCHLLGKAVVGNLASIGSGAVILPGVEIGEKAIVGAGAVVTTSVPPGATVTGIPAREHLQSRSGNAN